VAGPEDALRDAFAVAQVDKDHSAQVAAAMNPAHEHDALAGIFGGQFTAVVGALEVTQ
jgi:hypothetical protein